jgi:hypothetical protein
MRRAAKKNGALSRAVDLDAGRAYWRTERGAVGALPGLMAPCGVTCVPLPMP